jgi:4-diphosphocytidyl-2-C-methyl-D-erythritol kinase
MAVNGGRESVELAAPAKINLALLLGPVRSDRYHEVFSVMVPVTLADRVALRRSSGGLEVVCDVSPGEANLAARAVRGLEARLERRFDVQVTIEKRTPAGAGLGGGSSDAAATLLGLQRLLDLDVSRRLLHEVAVEVGADVPFFLWPGPQFAMGRGQVLRELELPELHAVIAVPDLSLSTARVYGWRDEDVTPTAEGFKERTWRLTSGVQRARTVRDLAPLVENDLEAPVVARHPEVGELKRRLLDAGAVAAAMSGSGSSVFGLFASEGRALAALRAAAPARAFYVTDLQPVAGDERKRTAKPAGEEPPVGERAEEKPSGKRRHGRKPAGGKRSGKKPPAR